MSTVYLSKTFPFQAIQFSQTVLIQSMQLSISKDCLLTIESQNSSLFNNSV